MINSSNAAYYISFLLVILIIAGFSGKVSARDMSKLPRVKLQSLDKVTARTMTFEARVGATIKFGPLYIKVQSCQKSSPIDKPESAAFMQIWEMDLAGKAQWVFSGWMFASSPGLSPMDHPIYDVWVIDCLADEEKIQVEVNGNDGDGVVPETPENQIKDQDHVLESE